MSALTDAIASVPVGRWAVAVSGGADSVAMLCLLRARPNLSLHVVHLDHETRGRASTDDAQFVRQFAGQSGLPCTLALRSEIEPRLAELPQNWSARYRAIRIELYRRVVAQHQLLGVILAHHADDQAETVLQRLIRGSGPNGLCGMAERACIGSLLVLRPLLGIDRVHLRDQLRQIGQAWREDASNESDQYLRNRLRRWLRDEPDLRDALLELAAACRALRNWATQVAPRLSESFRANDLQGIPSILARESARRWLLEHRARPGELTEAVLDRLVEMASHAASAPRQTFPGDVQVCRRGGTISARARGNWHKTRDR